jgi:3-hydroxyisobutyrate dehydrogenase-like beta-hydroxyacid dehydrogenase
MLGKRGCIGLGYIGPRIARRLLDAGDRPAFLSIAKQWITF